MKKIIFFLISLIIIFAVLFFVFKENLNINKILKNIRNDTGIKIKLEEKEKLSFYPNFLYQNELSANNDTGNLVIEKGSINISRDYRINSPFIINYQSPSILYKGINFRNSIINSEYSRKIIELKKFSAKIIDGNINLKGKFFLKDNKKIYLNGSYKNISINRILKQLKIANWERVKIKLSSSNFSLNTISYDPNNIIENLNGIMNISGSIFFVSKEEEHFGAVFLSLLADKFLNMKPLSKSINYLLEKFADKPSNISGIINIHDGVLKTEKLLIDNFKEKALLTGNLNLKSKVIDATIDLYENNIIFMTVEIKGNLKNPEILIGGDIFSNESNSEPKNIKEIFEKGIQKIVDDFLNLND